MFFCVSIYLHVSTKLLLLKFIKYVYLSISDNIYFNISRYTYLIIVTISTGAEQDMPRGFHQMLRPQELPWPEVTEEAEICEESCVASSKLTVGP